MKKIFAQVAKAPAVIKALMAVQVILIGIGIAELFDPCDFKHGLFMIVINGSFLYLNYFMHKWNTETH
ncbi:hypothetical protein UFOVP450_74 [uncultured Caudovirales phage]|uniref:Uncharacterized protein n=1 Tax=uncultured Caudovirales phage TaxID=2100421 RepID=A0A6J5MBK1_9CAUD|nr:hypothetical protein UFOVP450_74 [uncultured Caudovirales phage]